MYAPVRTKEMPANELNTYSYFKGPKPEPGRERPFHYSLQIKTTRSGSIRRQFSETKQAITSNPCPEATHMHEIDLLNTPPLALHSSVSHSITASFSYSFVLFPSLTLSLTTAPSLLSLSNI